MAKDQQAAKLIVRGGNHEGREYLLKGETITLGSGNSCAIALKGSYVAERHAVLEHRSDGVWTISNQSINGTYVNGERIVSRNLSPGDSVRVGPEMTLEFVVDAPAKRTNKQRKRKPGSGQLSVLTERPGLVVGIGAYLLAIVGLGLYLSGLDDTSDATGLSPELVHRVLENSRKILTTDLEPATSGTMIGNTEGPIDRNAEQAARYFRLMAYKRRVRGGLSRTDAREEADLIDGILEDVNRFLFRAWNLESQGRWKEAMKAYDSALSVVPDIRVPVARLAAYRRNKLKEVIER